MPRWQVTYPIVGFITVEVEADDEKAAIAAGWDVEHPAVPDQWETLEHVSRGNTNCFTDAPNDAYAEQVD